ncbi:MAG: SLBB domain-containing protein [Candidatus Eisenbacteria bacterium]
MRRWIGAVFALVCFSTTASAQTPNAIADEARRAVMGEDSSPPREALSARSPEPAAQSGTIDPARYVVGPGDRFELQLRGRLARTTSLTVDPEGRLSLPEAGTIDLAGLTLIQARQKVRDRMARAFRGVESELRLVQLRRFKVFVTGDVDTPGAYEVTAVSRVSEIVALAKPRPTASLRNVTLRHRDGSVSRADLALLASAGDAAGDGSMLDGDVVDIPVAREFVTSSGALARPGRFELAPGDSLSTLVRLSGGLLPSSSLDHAVVVRFTSATERESLAVALNGEGAAALATPLRDGDVLFIYYQPDFHQVPSVNLVGEVARPGSYPIRVGHDRLSDLIGWAGGLGARANAGNMVLFRNPEGVTDADPDLERLARLSREQMTESEYILLQTRLAERKNSFRIDWNRVSKDRSQRDLDLLLRNGDVVRVDRLVTSVRVEGQVRSPGLIEFVKERSANEYIRLAGDFTDRASKRSVRVTRANNGQVVPAGSIREIQPGDFIWVPERRERDPWNTFRDVLAVAGQIAVIVVAVRR